MTTLPAEGKMWRPIAEVGEQATDMLSRLVEQNNANWSITKQLKATNQTEVGMLDSEH